MRSIKKRHWVFSRHQRLNAACLAKVRRTNGAELHLSSRALVHVSHIPRLTSISLRLLAYCRSLDDYQYQVEVCIIEVCDTVASLGI